MKAHGCQKKGSVFFGSAFTSGDTAAKVLPLRGLHDFFPMCGLGFLLGMTFFACGHMGCLGCWEKSFPWRLRLSGQLCTLTKKAFFFLLEVRLWVHLPFYILGSCPVWNWRSCVCCPSPSEFIHASVLLYLDDTVSLESATTSGSYSLPTSSSAQTPEPWREGSDTDIPLSTHCPLYPKLLYHRP